MKLRLPHIVIFILFVVSATHCAKKGTPTGGKRDSIPPIIVRSTPDNYSTNFSGDEITIYFDEYIKLKELQKELIISPPFNNQPLITPLSTSKFLKIKILDTLRPNTTYSFNFGNSIVDNNEDNPYDYYKFVFSTGPYIDSLTVRGSVTDALLRTPEIPTTVMLYDAADAASDSLIYTKKPTYITTTKDSTGGFELSNIKEGTYLLLALKEKTNDYIFQPKNDKIGFLKETITVPTDSSYALNLFKEEATYKAVKPIQAGKNHILFGFEGEVDTLEVRVLNQTLTAANYKMYRDSKTDTLHYWYKTEQNLDSLTFEVKNRSKIDTFNLRLRNLAIDTLVLSTKNGPTLRLRDSLELKSTTPLISLNSEKIKINDQDSLPIQASVFLDTRFNLAKIYFEKKEQQSYIVQILPGAFTDFFDKMNDSLKIRVGTKPESDYGNITLKLQNANFPIIAQLVSSKFEIIDETYLSSNIPIIFKEIIPGQYFIRLIYDENKNRKWDTGNYLQRLQPEKVVYYPSKITVRANWNLNENFILK